MYIYIYGMILHVLFQKTHSTHEISSKSAVLICQQEATSIVVVRLSASPFSFLSSMAFWASTCLRQFLAPSEAGGQLEEVLGKVQSETAHTHTHCSPICVEFFANSDIHWFHIETMVNALLQ